MAVTLQDIAARAGVSKVAVSAALKDGMGNVFVSEATRQRVRALAEEMGYRPNGAARALATGRSRVVEFWAQNVHNPFFSAAFHAARRHLLSRELSLSLVEFWPGPPAAQVAGWDADSLLIFDCPWKPERLRQVLEDRGAAGRPRVSVGTYHQADGDYVGVDLVPGVREAVSHLLSRGCRRVAYLLDRWDDYPEEPRYRTYTEAVTAAERTPEYLVAPEASRRGAREFLREYVRAHGCPDALFCHNDLMAVGAYRALCDLGVRVPDDVALVGCDGIEEVEYLECPLSTIAQPVEAACELACRFLHTRIEDPAAPPQQQVLRAELVMRRSTGG